MIAVPANEAVHPGVTHAVGIEVQGKFFDYGSHWTQRSLCKVFNIAYELGFLLWVECKLIRVMGCLRALTTSVSLGWCSVRYVEAAAYFPICKMISWFQQFDCRSALSIGALVIKL
jgi:hypothetical protein